MHPGVNLSVLLKHKNHENGSVYQRALFTSSLLKIQREVGKRGYSIPPTTKIHDLLLLTILLKPPITLGTMTRSELSIPKMNLF